MSPVFQSLGELSDYVATNGIQVVDPGVPLESLVVARDDLWATQPSVRKVVGFIARNVSSIPLHVYERVSDADRQRVTDHPLARTLKTPAERTSAARFWERVIIDWLLHDRWCVMRVPMADGTEQMARLPVRHWRFKSDNIDRIVAVQLRRDGRWVDHPLDQFLFDSGYARSGANGTSPAVTLEDLLAESAEAVRYRRSIWRNGARVPAVLERPQNMEWSDSARQRFKRSWQNFVRGGGAEGGTPILEDGMKLVKVDAFNPKDTEDLEGRRLTDIEVATAYYIAPELLGIREGTYSNVESHRQALYRDALGPLIDQWVGAINAQLTPDLAGGRDLYVEAHVEAKLRGSFEQQATLLSTSTGAPWMTRSEARARMNLPQIEGADDLIVPLNVIEGGLASPRDTAPKARRGVGTKTLEEGLATVDRERAALAGSLADYRSALAAHLLDQLGVKNAVDLTEAFDIDARNAQLAALIAGRQRRVAQAAASEVLDEWNPDHDGWDPDVMDPWLAKAAEAKAEQANRGIYDAVAAAMVSPDWQDEVAAVFESDWPALWAVTIATAAASFGRNDAAQASGLTTKTWRTTSSNPRPEHAALNGVTIPIDSVFVVGGRWPGDPFMPAEQNANCQCFLEYSRGEDS